MTTGIVDGECWPIAETPSPTPAQLFRSAMAVRAGARFLADHGQREAELQTWIEALSIRGLDRRMGSRERRRRESAVARAEVARERPRRERLRKARNEARIAALIAARKAGLPQ